MSNQAQKTIGLELTPQGVQELSSLFDSASRILGLRSVASVTKYASRIQEEVGQLPTPAPEGEQQIITLRLTEPECNELSALFDHAIKHSGISAVGLVHKYMSQITALLETAIVAPPTAAGKIVPFRK